MASFRMPAIRDLTGDEEPEARMPEESVGVADLVLVRADELLDALREGEEVKELSGGPGMLFTRFGRGFLGVPFCRSDGEVTCWPMRGGLDDNPFAWTCVCEPPRESKEPSPGWKLPEPNLADCYFNVGKPGGTFTMGCVNQNCQGTCRMVFVQRFGTYVAACECT